MSQKHPTLFSIIESRTHGNFSALYAQLGLQESRFFSMRKALRVLKKQTPDYAVVEFFYGYSNNYAGVNISNLDVFLISLRRYSPETKVIVLVEKYQRQYVDKLNDILPLHAVLLQPVQVHLLRNMFTFSN